MTPAKQKELSLAINNLMASGVTVIEITSMIATEMHKILLIKYLLNEKNDKKNSWFTVLAKRFPDLIEAVSYKTYPFNENKNKFHCF